MENKREITIKENGVFEIRDVKEHTEDGIVTRSKPHRIAIVPGDNFNAKAYGIESITKIVWTPTIVSAYKTLTNG